MGCDALARDDCGNDTTPVHTVTLTRPLRVMTHEMTQAVHRALTGASPSRLGGCDRCPVEQVSWYDAVRAANALSLSEGLVPAYAISGETVAWDRAADGWRLPTEAEWEYAARGGDDHVYAGSDDRDAVAWWQGNSEGRPSEVGTKAANGYGLHDLSGNVWEWTWNHPEPYTDAPKTDPAGPDAAVLTSPDPSSRGDERVLRGGAWADFPEGCQVTYRGWITARHTDVVLGYRLVRWE
jgi:formylglycine-generating enzyme required for sulfatase activity